MLTVHQGNNRYGRGNNRQNMRNRGDLRIERQTEHLKYQNASSFKYTKCNEGLTIGKGLSDKQYTHVMGHAATV